MASRDLGMQRIQVEEGDMYRNGNKDLDERWRGFDSSEGKDDDPVLCFMPSAGIDYDVILTELRHYFGQGATLTRGSHPKNDGPGYYIRAHIVPTKSMISELKTDTCRWREEMRSVTNRDYSLSRTHALHQRSGPTSRDITYQDQRQHERRDSKAPFQATQSRHKTNSSTHSVLNDPYSQLSTDQAMRLPQPQRRFTLIPATIDSHDGNRRSPDLEVGKRPQKEERQDIAKESSNMSLFSPPTYHQTVAQPGESVELTPSSRDQPTYTRHDVKMAILRHLKDEDQTTIIRSKFDRVVDETMRRIQQEQFKQQVKPTIARDIEKARPSRRRDSFNLDSIDISGLPSMSSSFVLEDPKNHPKNRLDVRVWGDIDTERSFSRKILALIDTGAETDCISKNLYYDLRAQLHTNDTAELKWGNEERMAVLGRVSLYFAWAGPGGKKKPTIKKWKFYVVRNLGVSMLFSAAANQALNLMEYGVIDLHPTEVKILNGPLFVKAKAVEKEELRIREEALRQKAAIEDDRDQRAREEARRKTDGHPPDSTKEVTECERQGTRISKHGRGVEHGLGLI